jgi:hypothetical protein
MNRPNRTLMSLGLASLALANLSHWWLEKHSTVSTDLGDGVYGFGMGVAIAVMLLAFKRGASGDQRSR